MNYTVRTKLLARAFVDAQSLVLSVEEAAEFARSLPGTFHPVQALEQGPFGVRETTAFVREHERLFLLGGAGFDYTGIPNDLNGGNLSDLDAFAKEASTVLRAAVERFGRLPHRLSLVQDGFLRDMTPEEMSRVGGRLLSLPPRAVGRDVFEWDWRVATRDTVDVGGRSEECNLLVTIKRASGTFEPVAGQRRTFDALRVELDVNTTNLSTIGRFDGPRVEDFFVRALEVHAALAREAQELVFT